MRAWTLTLLLIAATLTGCLGDDAPEDIAATETPSGAPGPTTDNVIPTTPPPGGPDPNDISDAAWYSFSADPRPSATILEDGTFRPHDSAVTATLTSQVTGDDTATHEIDLRPHLDPGVPTRVSVHVTYDVPTWNAVSPVKTGSNMGAILEASDGATTWGRTYSSTPGSHGIDAFALLPANGTGQLIAGAHMNAPSDHPEQAYTVRVTLEPLPLTLPPGVPVAVDLTPATHVLDLHPYDAGGPVSVAIWGPDDAFLGHVKVPDAGSRLDLATDAPEGRYVLVPHGDLSGLNLTATPRAWNADKADPTTRPPQGPELDLQALALHIEAHTTTALDEQGTATWTTDLPSVPLGFGLAFHSTDGARPESGATLGTIENAQGTLLAFSDDTDLDVRTDADVRTWMGPLGARALAPGPLDIHAEAGDPNAVAVSLLVVHHVR